MSIKRDSTGKVIPSAKTLAARERSDRFMLPAGDVKMSHIYKGGALINKREANTATGPQINLMLQPVYKPGDGECACGCGHRPGCTDFLEIPSVGEPD